MDLPLKKMPLLSDKIIFDLVQNETRRLSALHELDILNTAEEDQFSDLVKMASGICGMPISSISLVDSNRVWLNRLLKYLPIMSTGINAQTL